MCPPTSPNEPEPMQIVEVEQPMLDHTVMCEINFLLLGVFIEHKTAIAEFYVFLKENNDTDTNKFCELLKHTMPGTKINGILNEVKQNLNHNLGGASDYDIKLMIRASYVTMLTALINTIHGSKLMDVTFE